MSKRVRSYIRFHYKDCMFLVLQWIEEVQPLRKVFCTDFLSVLNSLISGTSTARQEMLNYMQSLFRIRWYFMVSFMWVPGQMGVVGNEDADQLAKQALQHIHIEIKVTMSKYEIKKMLAKEMSRKWQKDWDKGIKVAICILFKEVLVQKVWQWEE